MRKWIVAACMAVSLVGFSQNEKYHRVKVSLGDDGILKLAKAGISVDHGQYKKGVSFTTDLSETEIKRVKELGLPYEIVIEDVVNYYQHQNDNYKNYNPKNAVQSNGSCSSCRNYDIPQNFNLGSMGGFFTYQEMLDNLDSMHAKYPNLITARQPINDSLTIEGRPLYVLKISDNPDSNEVSENQLLFTALHHAREPESLSQLIYYMWYLLENYDTDQQIKYLVDNLEIYFVPCVNPDGYIYNQTTNPSGGGMWRKNRRDNGGGTFGVDLNRNYGYNWGYDDIGSSPDPSNDTYRGTAGFSEAETFMMKDLCMNHNFRLAVNYHTYGNDLIYPWGYDLSIQTPDSAYFGAYSVKMVSCNGYTTGTGDQTVGYVTNGDSDDWMYGDQISKPMILSMTPEAGTADDGFWPAITRIIDIAKGDVEMNLYACRVVAAYGEAKVNNNYYITSPSTYVKFDLTRYGMLASNLVVYFTPLTSNITNSASANVYTGMNLLETRTDSIQINLNTASMSQGDLVSYAIGVSNGAYTIYDTITQVYGQPVIAYYNNCDAVSGFTSSGGAWGVSTTQYVEGTGSLTDSPSGSYANNTNKTFATTNTIDLTDAIDAHLSFYGKWDIEKGYDYVELSVSTDNGTTYTPLCGKYTKDGTVYQTNGTPVYDGTQGSWVKEGIGLDAYIGQNILLRYHLKSDVYTTGDGFYFDDFKVEKLVNPVGIKSNIVENAYLLQNIPNPCNNSALIKYSLPQTNTEYKLQVVDGLGKLVYEQKIDPSGNQVTIDVSGFQNGVYFYKLEGTADISVPKSMVVIH